MTLVPSFTHPESSASLSSEFVASHEVSDEPGFSGGCDNDDYRDVDISFNISNIELESTNIEDPEADPVMLSSNESVAVLILLLIE